MKIKVSEATGATLDWMVAKCEGWELKPNPHRFDSSPILSKNGFDNIWFNGYKPSKDWAQGGPIIEREKIDLMSYLERADLNMSWRSCMTGTKAYYGPTPLVAAMRCYCASKLGDEVEVPEELL